VMEGDRGDLFGNSEDDVEILAGQQFGFSALEPLGPFGVLAFGAMPIAAGIVSNTSVRAVVAFLDVAAQGSRAADLDGAHHAQLVDGLSVPAAVSLPVLSKNIGQLESRPRHGLFLPLELGCRLIWFRLQPVQGADGRTDQLWG